MLGPTAVSALHLLPRRAPTKMNKPSWLRASNCASWDVSFTCKGAPKSSYTFMQLREELGPKAMEGREPPPRRALAGVNKRPDLIERRRRELEQWLWRLVADPELARSRPLNGFLELQDAARLVQRCGPCLASQPINGCTELPLLSSTALSWPLYHAREGRET